MIQTMIKKTANKLRKSKGGFTLIELLVVIAILAILAAILIPMVSGFVGKAKTQAENADAHTAFTAAVATQTQSGDKYTGFDDTSATPMVESDLDPFLGSHGNFTVTHVYFGSDGAVRGVEIKEGTDYIVYDSNKSGDDQYKKNTATTPSLT